MDQRTIWSEGQGPGAATADRRGRAVVGGFAGGSVGWAAGPTWRVMEVGVAGRSRAEAAALLKLVKQGRGGGQRVLAGCFPEVRCPVGARAREIGAGGHGDLGAIC